MFFQWKTGYLGKPRMIENLISNLRKDTIMKDSKTFGYVDYPVYEKNDKGKKAYYKYEKLVAKDIKNVRIDVFVADLVENGFSEYRIACAIVDDFALKYGNAVKPGSTIRKTVPQDVQNRIFSKYCQDEDFLASVVKDLTGTIMRYWQEMESSDPAEISVEEAKILKETARLKIQKLEKTPIEW